MNFKLARVSPAGAPEPVYTYIGPRPRIVEFSAHPTKPFVWCFTARSDAEHSTAVLEAFIDAGFRQHEFPGGFDEAIRNLSI